MGSALRIRKKMGCTLGNLDTPCEHEELVPRGFVLRATMLVDADRGTKQRRLSVHP